MAKLLLNEMVPGELLRANSSTAYIAFAISLAVHFAVMRALPWLEAGPAMSPVTMVAELKQLPPPPSPEPLVEPKPIEPPPKPENVKAVRQPTPKPDALTSKPQAVTLPVLMAENTDQAVNDYSVPDTPQQTIVPRDVMATVSAPSATSSAKDEAASTSSTWDDDTLWQEYGRNLQQICAKYKQYPAIAARRGWQGSVKVAVHFSANGQTLSVIVQKSSGQRVLDEQALEMVRKGLNDLPVPAMFKGREFRLFIPIDFRLTES